MSGDAGYYQDAKASITCDECPEGTYSDAGATECISCAAGKSTGAGSVSPDPCTYLPSKMPTGLPSRFPSLEPTLEPTSIPTFDPTTSPTSWPTLSPTAAPTAAPTNFPTFLPSFLPTLGPSAAPSLNPSAAPSLAPSTAPTLQPTPQPSLAPSLSPTLLPSLQPSPSPTALPSSLPSLVPTPIPSPLPTLEPTPVPTIPCQEGHENPCHQWATAARSEIIFGYLLGSVTFCILSWTIYKQCLAPRWPHVNLQKTKFAETDLVDEKGIKEDKSHSGFDWKTGLWRNKSASLKITPVLDEGDKKEDGYSSDEHHLSDDEYSSDDSHVPSEGDIAEEVKLAFSNDLDEFSVMHLDESGSDLWGSSAKHAKQRLLANLPAEVAALLEPSKAPVVYPTKIDESLQEEADAPNNSEGNTDYFYDFEHRLEPSEEKAMYPINLDDLLPGADPPSDNEGDTDYSSDADHRPEGEEPLYSTYGDLLRGNGE